MVEVSARDRDGPPFLSTQALKNAHQAQTTFGLDDEKNRQEGGSSSSPTNITGHC